MKLAEALLERADVQKDCTNLLTRIEDNSMVQEGDEPAEDPAALMNEYERKVERLGMLIQQINAANAKVAFSDKETIADAIVRRDMLSRELQAYRNLYQKIQIRPNRYSNSEIRFVRCLDPAALQKKIDKLSKEYRELDMQLQSLNWTTELPDS